MVKDSGTEKRDPLPLHGLLFLNQGLFYMHHPTERIPHTTAFVTPECQGPGFPGRQPKISDLILDLVREIAQWVHQGGAI